MEFSFDISDVATFDDQGFAILDSTKLNPRSNSSTSPYYLQQYSAPKKYPGQEKLSEILDKIGEASSKAQGLKATITTYNKFLTSEGNRIYMKASGQKVYGILKVGSRNLFYHDSRGSVKELKPLCVLDFYVHESVQRLGIGKELFELMLKKENAEPRLIAYDRPSPKLFGFLKKHYGLSSHVPQNNNYVIFNAYWERDFKYKSAKSEEFETKQPLKLNTKQENKIENGDKYGAYDARQHISSLKKNDLNDRKTTYGNLYRPDSENAYVKDTRYNRPESAILDKRSSNNGSYREEYKKSEPSDYTYHQKLTRPSTKVSQRSGPSEDDMKLLYNRNVATEKKRQEQKSSCPWATNDSDNLASYTSSKAYGNHYGRKKV